MMAFAILFIFLAVAAYLRFGPSLAGFSTLASSVRSQFLLLVSLEVPDIQQDAYLTIYIVSFVVMCSLAMLNFFLAIVVNGYTEVQEKSAEDKVAQGFFTDCWLAIRDVFLWKVNKWPSKITILNALSREYPEIFRNGYEEAGHSLGIHVTVSRHDFQRIFVNQQTGVQKADRTDGSRQGSMPAYEILPADEIVKINQLFSQLCRLRILWQPQPGNYGGASASASRMSLMALV